MTPEHELEPLNKSLVLVCDFADGVVTYTVTAHDAEGNAIEPDLTDLFDAVLDRLGGSPCADDDWTNSVTGHGGDCGCISCHMSQVQ